MAGDFDTLESMEHSQQDEKTLDGEGSPNGETEDLDKGYESSDTLKGDKGYESSDNLKSDKGYESSDTLKGDELLRQAGSEKDNGMVDKTKELITGWKGKTPFVQKGKVASGPEMGVQMTHKDESKAMRMKKAVEGGAALQSGKTGTSF